MTCKSIQNFSCYSTLTNMITIKQKEDQRQLLETYNVPNLLYPFLIDYLKSWSLYFNAGRFIAYWFQKIV